MDEGRLRLFALRGRLIGYVLAAGLSLVALAVRLLTRELLPEFPFFSFAIAVMIVSAFTGPGPAIFAMLFTGVLAGLFAFPPGGLEAAKWSGQIWLAVLLYWVLLGGFVAVVQALLRERERLRQADRRLRELNVELESRIVDRTRTLQNVLAEREMFESKLRESEELYRRIVDLGRQIPWTAAPDGRMLSLGSRWTDFTGHLVQNTLRDWWNCVDPDDLIRVERQYRHSIATGELYDVEHRIRRADGDCVWCRVRASPMRDDSGTVIRWYGTIEDINERRLGAERLSLVQAELIHVARLSAMGAMASTLAHELNQPLTAISNYVRGSQRILTQIKDPRRGALVSALVEAEHSAAHAAGIIRRLREMVRPAALHSNSESVKRLVTDSCSLALVDAAAMGLSHRIDIQPAAQKVMVDRVQIEQVMINLLRNAVDAMKSVPERRILISGRPTKPDLFELAVKDSGPGLPEAALERLFQPFFTTKTEGMGVGLSISRTIVESHGGQIWAENDPAGGAVIRFTLPVA